MAETDLNKLEKFFDKCKTKEHYQDLNECPFEIGEWKTDKSKRIPYARWITDNSNLPSLKCSIEVPYKEMYAEGAQHLEDFVKHRGSFNPGWSSYAVHGQGAIYTQPHDYYIKEGMFTEETMPPYDWTEIADSCPVTVEWLKDTWPFKKYKRVRFMLLEPNGYIMPHSDFKERRLAAFNVALNNPDGVEFYMEDAGMIPFQPGEARAIDIGRNHAVINRGTENRIHMIIHGLWDDNFEEMINQSFDDLREELGKTS